MAETYNDFYSKTELIDLCLQHVLFEVGQFSKSLGMIFDELRRKDINRIYFRDENLTNDLNAITINYLEDQGHYVLAPRNFNISFRDGTAGVNVVVILQIIATATGFNVIDIRSVGADILHEMKIDKSDFPKKLIEQIQLIENEYDISIEFASFRKTTRPIINYRNQLFINVQHSAFQSLYTAIDTLPYDVIHTFLAGLLGLSITVVPIETDKRNSLGEEEGT
jgi:hypothetical protein